MRYFSILGMLFACANAVSYGQMVASNDRVRVEVRTVTDTDHKDLKGTSADTVTQNKALAIRLTGKAQNPETRVVKWKVFGRSLTSNNLSLINTAEFKLDLGARGEQQIETKRVATTYTPDHSVSSGRSRRGRMPRAKKVQASGTKYAGYSVQVLDANTVVGEASDPVGIGGRKEP